MADDNRVLAAKEAQAREEAVLRRSEAEQDRDRTAKQLRVATAERLAVQGREVLPTDPTLSLLLTAEAVRTSTRAAETPNHFAEQVIRDGLMQLGGYPLAGRERQILAVAISPDSQWLATGGKVLRSVQQMTVRDNRLLLWNLGTPDLDPIELLGHESGIMAVAFSADGRWLASSGGDEFSPLSDNKVRLWDLSAPLPGSAPRILGAHTSYVSKMAFSPDGRWLATASTHEPMAEHIDRGIFLWDLSSGPEKVRQTVMAGGDLSSFKFTAGLSRRRAMKGSLRGICSKQIQTQPPHCWDQLAR